VSSARLPTGRVVTTATERLGVNILRIRLGAALQKHRLQRNLTQAQLAEFADLSLKYVGEIERGEANTTLEVLERLAAAVGWNPMDALEGLREPLSEGVRMLLLDEVQQMLDRLRNMVRWLQALDPALHPAGRSTPARSEAPRDAPSRTRPRPSPRKPKPDTG
jgi:transcriptional regulator with XRE-family HTH domain